MGIQGLLPFLAHSTRDACISEFENEFVAVDAYCWLHKGIYSCAFDLAMHKPTTKYVTYCMRYIEMMCHYNVKPILVFDGRQLFSKLETEKKRRDERKRKFQKGKELLRAGKTGEGRKLLGESVDVTHELAVNLMKECHKRNIDCIVAPYEADAQLAFFSLKNIVKCVVTEDSDLLAYGCERVMFKMDTSGKGKLIEKKNLHFSLGMTPEELNEDIFRYICILSGCDYLPSIKSIGPANALKFVKIIRDNNIYVALPRLPFYLNKEKLQIPAEYVKGFRVAENTFRHQLVYDPFQRAQIPLNPVKNDDDIVGEKLPEDEAFQLAVGNVDPMTMKKVHDYDPDKFGTGFTILWSTDMLPNAAPRKNIFKSNDILVEAKKRQREGLESDSVHVVANDLKKPRTPGTSNTKKCIKNSTTVPANGFVFEPKVLSQKKNNLNALDESKCLSSRYFTMGRLKKPECKRQVLANCVNVKRKDKSDEDYSRKLLEENFWADDEESPKSCSCDGNSSQLENQCASCGKCLRCCHCMLEQTQPENQGLDESAVEVKKSEVKKEPVFHSLLDEIYKEKEETKEGEAEPKSERRTPSPNKSSLYLKILSRIINRGSGEVVDSPEKKNEEEQAGDDPGRRSPSPVFILQKTNSSSKSSNIPDTTATPTSTYFSSGAEYSEKTPKGSRNSDFTLQRKPWAGGSRTMSSKSCRTSIKNPSVHRTLFDFGFKKGDKMENS